MIIYYLVAGFAVYFAWTVLALERNHKRARPMNIPLVRLPIDPMNILWVVLEPHLLAVVDKLPFSFGNFGKYSRRGWFFADKAGSHLRYGPVWALVTPRDIYVYVADPGAVHEIFTRREDFLRPSKMYSGFNISLTGVL